MNPDDVTPKLYSMQTIWNSMPVWHVQAHYAVL